MAGIAQDVTVLVMQLLNVVMVSVMVMRPMNHAQAIVMKQAVVMVKLLTVMDLANAGQKHGLVMVTVMVQLKYTMQIYAATI